MTGKSVQTFGTCHHSRERVSALSMFAVWQQKCLQPFCKKKFSYFACDPKEVINLRIFPSFKVFGLKERSKEPTIIPR
jgi:hypothetical protein